MLKRLLKLFGILALAQSRADEIRSPQEQNDLTTNFDETSDEAPLRRPTIFPSLATTEKPSSELTGFPTRTPTDSGLDSELLPTPITTELYRLPTSLKIKESTENEELKKKNLEALVRSSFLNSAFYTFCAAGVMFVIAAHRQNRQNQQLDELEQNLPPPPPTHRDNEAEIKGAIGVVVESAFYCFNEEDRKLLLEVEKEKLEEICNELRPAKNLEEITKIIAEKYGEELSKELSDFLEAVYENFTQLKETRRTQDGNPQNFVYNAAMKGPGTVIEIDQQMLEKYLGIFDEIVKEKFVKLRAEAENSPEPQAAPLVSRDSVSRLKNAENIPQKG